MKCNARLCAVFAATLLFCQWSAAATVDSLVTYWALDDNTSDTAAGGSTIDDGRWVGTPSYGVGQFGNGIVLDGSKFISVPASRDVDRSGGDVSISAWFTVGGWDKSWQCLIAKGEGNRWRVARRGGDPAALSYAGGSADIFGGSVNDGKWHHVVAVSEAGISTRLIIDGLLVATGGGPGLGAAAGPVNIGGNPQATGRQWKGKIDDVGIFSTPLNDHQAKAIYDLGVHPKYNYTLAQVNQIIWAHPRGPGSSIKVDDTNWEYTASEPTDGSFFVQLGVDGSGMAGSTGPSIRAFIANETILPFGKPLTLSWDIGPNIDTLVIDQVVGNVLPLTTGGRGEITFTPSLAAKTTYTISATNADGTNTREVTVQFTDQPIIDFFTASRNVVEPKTMVDLKWSVRNATSLDLNGTNVTELSELSVNVAETIPFILTASHSTSSMTGEVIITVVIPGEPIISEFNANNSGGFVDQDGDGSDWIEVLNPTATPALLHDYYLTDDPDNLTKWKIPFHVLDPGSTLLVFASGKDRTTAGSELHANFSLRAGGEYLAIVKLKEGSPVILSQFEDFPRQFEDISFGFYPDGVTTGYFTTPTPNGANRVGLIDYVRDTTFFPDRGFYDAPISVTITSNTPGASIHYTTDGSPPSRLNGTLYTGPIPISTTTTLRTVAFKADHLSTSVDTRTYIFLDDVIKQPTRPSGFPSSWGGQSADYQVDPDVVNNPLYRGTIKDDLKSIRSISIVMRTGDLFGSGGIYSNPNGSGASWERAGSMEIVNPDNSPGFQVNCAVRIQGGVGRNPGFLKHSFRLLYKRPFGPTKLNYPLFDDAMEDAENATDRFDTITLRAGFNNAWHRDNSNEERQAQYLRDQWVRDSQRAMGHASGHGTFVHLYLNGLYWGLYNVVERPNADFASNYYGGRKSEWDSLNSFPRNVVDGTATAWVTAQSIARGGVADQDGYDELAQYVDIPNLIDYMLLNFYAGNQDWDDHNWYAGRHRVQGAGYKFFSWDAERTLESITGNNRTSVGQDNKPSRLFERLKRNPEFRMEFADHAHKHLFNDGVLTPGQTHARYQKLANFIDRAIVGESARWGDSQRSTPYTRNGAWVTERDRLLNRYFPRRTEVVLGHLRGHNPRLYPSTDAPVFSRHGGHISSKRELTMTSTRGVIYYTKDGSDPRMPGGAVNPKARVYDGSVSSTSLVSSGSTWKFLDDGTDQGTAWRNPSFNDAQWDSGPAELGYGDGGEAHVVSFGPNGNNKHITTYFRHRFAATNVLDFEALTLDVMRDDGAIVYLNGSVLTADNMPGGTITYQTTATGTTGGEDESTFHRFAVPAFNLREGWNTIAVEIHQISGSSSDISFDLRLQATKSNTVNPLLLTETGKLKARALDRGEWSALNEAFFIVDAETAGSNNLAITEINYRPLPPTPQEEEAGLNSRSDTEFVEVTNIGPTDVDLTNVRFTDGISFNFSDSLLGIILPTGRSVILANDLAGFTERYPSVPTSMIAGEFSGNLSDDGERILLTAVNGTVIREFTYNDKLPWPEAADGDGKTLVLIDPFSNPDHADPFNWRASAVTGGRPGTSDVTSFGGVPTADKDLDALIALAEYAFGSSDSDPADAPFPIGAVEFLDFGTGPEGYFTISHQRNVAADDVEFVVQVSGDFVNWRTGPGNVEFVRAVNNGDGTETVTYRSSVPLPTAGREFMRLLLILK